MRKFDKKRPDKFIFDFGQIRAFERYNLSRPLALFVGGCKKRQEHKEMSVIFSQIPARLRRTLGRFVGLAGAALFSLVLASCAGGGFGRTGDAGNASDIPGVNPVSEPVSAAAGPISAESQRKVAGVVSGLNLGGSEEVSSEDIAVSNDSGILDSNPFSSPAPAARSSGWGARADSARKTPGYKAFEVAVPSDNPLMTVAVWISETSPDSPEKKLERDPEADRKFLYLRLQVFIAVRHVAQIAGGGVEVLDSEVIVVEEKRPDPKPEPACLAGEFRDQSGSCSPIFGAGLLCPAGTLPTNGITAAELNMALRLAARNGDAARVCEALRRGAVVNDNLDDAEFTPLQEAVSGGHLEAAKVLLANGAEVNKRKGGAGRSPLDLAARDDEAEVAALLRDADGRCFIETGPLCGEALVAVNFSSSGVGIVSAEGEGGALAAGGEVRQGATVMFTAIPGAGYYVSGWSGNCGGVGEVADGLDGTAKFCGLAADFDLNVRAEFSAIPSLAGPLCPSGSLSSNGLTPAELDAGLVSAAQANNLEGVCERLRRGASVEAREQSGLYRRAALMIAAHNGHLELAKLLHANGANVNSRVGNGNGGGTPHAGRWSSHGDSGFTALMYAAGMGGDAEMVGWLLDSGADANLGDSRGRLPLWEAAHYGRVEAMELLLDHGVDANGADVWGLAPLHAAGPHYSPEDGEYAEMSYAAEVAGGLLSQGAEVNARDSWGRSPLDVFAKWSHPNVAAVLRSRGGRCFVETGPLCGEAVVVTSETVCESGSLSANGMTPAELDAGLISAAQANNLEGVCEHLRRGASVEAQEQSGLHRRTALMIAAHDGHMDLARLLHANGADVNSRVGNGSGGGTPHAGRWSSHADSGFTALMYAAGMGGDAEMVGWLLDNGADANLGDSRGRLPLWEAAHYGRVEVMELLLDGGAGVNGADVWGLAPLHAAGPHYSPEDGEHAEISYAAEVAGNLLSRGAEVNARDSWGRSPLDVFAKWSHPNVAAVLRDAGGKCFVETGPLCGEAVVVTSETVCESGSLSANGLTTAELNMTLRLAARGGDVARACEALRRGAEVNDNLDNVEFTPLQEAVSGGHLEAAKLLLTNGAEVNKRKGGTGRSPLDLAARDEEAEIAALLRDADGRCFLETGPLCGSIPAAKADPATAGYSCPAGSLPRGNYTQEQLDQNFHAAGWSARADAVCKWLRRGANVDSGLDGGWLGGKTVLHRAAWGEYEIAVLLLENGADVNVKDRWSETPLHQAVAHHSGKIAVLLLENGADVNAKGFHDYTPLHDAASQGAREMVTLLLEHGADVGATNDNGETPLDVARRKKHAAIAALLEAAENLPVAAAAPAEADALAGELRTSFAGAFNPSPAFGDAFGAVPGASESFLTRLNSLMRSSAGTGGNAWNSFAGWQRENEYGRMWFSTGQRGDFGFGAGGNGAGGDLSASPFAALVGNGMLAGGETGFAADGKLRVAAFADYQAKSLLDGEDKQWTQWAARGTAIETAMTEAERFSGLSENQTRGAMTEIHLGGGDLGVALQAGAVSESDSVLSGTAGDENLRGLSSRTAFAGLSGAANLFGSGWRLRGSAHLGRSWAESEGMLLDSDLWASAFSAGLERGGWLYSNDGFVLRFSQPLRVERWEMELIGDGGARRLGADASGRQLDVDAAYRLPLSGGGWLLLSAGVRRDGGHSSSSDLEAGALFSVERGF